MFDDECGHGHAGSVRPESRAAQTRAAVHAGDLDRLVSRRRAGDDADRRAWDVERRGEGGDDRVVGRIVDRRGSDPNDQAAVADTVDRIARGASGTRGCRRRDAVTGATDRRLIRSSSLTRRLTAAVVRRPKIAVPTRTIVAPSSIATSKSWLMPIESSAAGRPGSPAATSASRRSRSCRNHGRESSGFSGNGRHDHQPAQIEPPWRRGRPARGRASSARRRRTSSPRAPDRPEAGSAARVPTLDGRRVQPAEQVEAVDRLNPARTRGGLLRLVGLQVADEVPLEREIAQRVDLVEAFLNAILAEVALAGRRGRAHGVGIERLGNGDERDASRAAARRAAPPHDAAAHGLELRGISARLRTDDRAGSRSRARSEEVGGARSYLIFARIALAASAFAPVGASFRYSWNGPFASAGLPWLKIRHAEPVVRVGHLRIELDGLRRTAPLLRRSCSGSRR